MPRPAFAASTPSPLVQARLRDAEARLKRMPATRRGLGWLSLYLGFAAAALFSLKGFGEAMTFMEQGAPFQVVASVGLGLLGLAGLFLLSKLPHRMASAQVTAHRNFHRDRKLVQQLQEELAAQTDTPTPLSTTPPLSQPESLALHGHR